MIRIVNKNKSNFDIYIGRGSKWGNPFKIGIDGTRAEVIVKYEQYIRNTPILIESLYELKDKTLGCYCHPLPCHGDILKKLYFEFHNPLLSY